MPVRIIIALVCAVVGGLLVSPKVFCGCVRRMRSLRKRRRKKNDERICYFRW